MKFFTNPGDNLKEWLTIDQNGMLTQPNIYGGNIPTRDSIGNAAAAIINTSGRFPYSGNHFRTNVKTNLSVGWYTIAVSNNGRATGRIGIRETYSSRHQAVTFYAGHHYGGSINQNCINVTFSSGRHSGNPLGALRLKTYGTYDGAMLQCHLRDGTNQVEAYLLGDNFQTSGWIMKDWIADGTDPGDLGNFNNINNNSTVGAYSNLNDLQYGGASWDGHILPGTDNAWTCGRGAYRFQNYYGMNSSIQTSDENLKQDIEVLDDAEMRAAKRLSALFTTYRWKERVEQEGTSARIHTGVIAQRVKSAMEAEGLDPARYSFYCIDEWYEDSEGTKLPVDAPAREGDSVGIGTNSSLGGNIIVPPGFEKVTRYSVRYPELLSFIAAYSEKRFSSIESRLAALES